jgi:hypothetical protein
LKRIDEEIPMTEHDIQLTAIVTPEEIIDIKPPFKPPKGIYWEMLAQQKIEAIPILLHRRNQQVKG